MPYVTSAPGAYETLPSESKGKKLLDGFLVGRERVQEVWGIKHLLRIWRR